MEVVLLEKVGRFGKMGDVVKVKDGYARNFLIPRHKALRATKENLAFFESRKAELQKASNDQKAVAEKLAEKISKVKLKVVRQAGEDGRLYGSVTARDLVDVLREKEGIEIDRKAVQLDFAIKNAGEYSIKLHLHSEVDSALNIVIAMSEADQLSLEEEEANKKAAARAARAAAGQPEQAEKPRRAPRKSKSKSDDENEE